MRPSTFSIVGFDAETGELGIAVASKFLAVGAVVPWARAGAGAVATQSYANTSYGPRGLDLMASGLSAEEALGRLLADDAEHHRRQVGLVDARGGSATFTGEGCHAWAGGRAGPGYAAQGNILTGPEVVDAMADAFKRSRGSLAERLLAALTAGDAAGGDRRGRQSAALLVVREGGGYDRQRKLRRTHPQGRRLDRRRGAGLPARQGAGYLSVGGAARHDGQGEPGRPGPNGTRDQCY